MAPTVRRGSHVSARCGHRGPSPEERHGKDPRGAPRYFALARSFSASAILSDAQDQSTGITPSAMTR